ncbi:MAG TPA: hypothetical protein VGI95_19040 [Caulobacteraceae bacterium]|jgi:hypothetical protein
MRFSDEGLVLGFGTILVKFKDGSEHPSKRNESRLLALLAAAHLTVPSPTSLSHVSRAAQRWREGQHALASMHLALSRIDRLKRPFADAHRLFLANEQLAAGLAPDALLNSIEAGESAWHRLLKYDENQPRAPAGSGEISGEWVSADGGAPASSSPDAHADRIPTGMATVPSVDAQIQMPDPAHSEVNPSTITPAVQPPVGSIHACRDALVDCVNAAVRESRYDSANDNSRFLDIENCKAAASVCDTLSWMIEDLPVAREGV